MKKSKSVLTIAALAAVMMPNALISADTIGASYNSTGSVMFTPSTETAATVDPTNPNPNQPITPLNPDGVAGPTTDAEGAPGPLTLDFASDLYFGTPRITPNTQIYHASAQKYETANGNIVYGPDFVQLTDDRGNFRGWNLSVKQTTQFRASSGQEIAGASVSFGDPEHLATNGSGDSVATAPGFTLTPDGTSVLVLAGDAASRGTTNGTSGTHLVTFGDRRNLSTSDVNGDGSPRGTTDTTVKLSIPGKANKLIYEKYLSVLDWTLGATPTSIAK